MGSDTGPGNGGTLAFPAFGTVMREAPDFDTDVLLSPQIPCVGCRVEGGRCSV